MATAQQSWKDVGSRLESLSLKLHYHIEEEHAETETDPRHRTPLQQLVDALDDVIEGLESAGKDTAVRQDVKEIGRSFADALGVAVSTCRDDVRKALDRVPRGHRNSDT